VEEVACRLCRRSLTVRRAGTDGGRWWRSPAGAGLRGSRPV